MHVYVQILPKFGNAASSLVEINKIYREYDIDEALLAAIPEVEEILGKRKVLASFHAILPSESSIPPILLAAHIFQMTYAEHEAEMRKQGRSLQGGAAPALQMSVQPPPPPGQPMMMTQQGQPMMMTQQGQPMMMMQQGQPMMMMQQGQPMMMMQQGQPMMMMQQGQPVMTMQHGMAPPGPQGAGGYARFN
jgi:hypothetical protein